MSILNRNKVPALAEMARTAKLNKAEIRPLLLGRESLIPGVQKSLSARSRPVRSLGRPLFDGGIVWPPRGTYHGSRFPETKRKWLFWSTALIIGGTLAMLLAAGGIVALPIGAIGAAAAAAGVIGWIVASIIF